MFITDKIHDVCPDAQVTFIPKSLYQLFVYYTVLQQLIDSAEKHIAPKDSLAFLQTYMRWSEKTTATGNSVGFLQVKMWHESAPDVFQAAREYHANPHVLSAFWDINENINRCLNTVSGGRSVAMMSSTLKEITDYLIDDVMNKYKIWQKLQKEFGASFNQTLERKYVSMVTKLPLDSLKPIIKDLIIAEYECPMNTYCIYRGESIFSHSSGRERTYIEEGRPINLSISFSDGLFAGSIRDCNSGSALGVLLEKGNLFRVDLPKRALLKGSIPIVIPPVIPMGSALGLGEERHVRLKRKRGGSVVDFSRYTPEQIPEISFVEEAREIENFWKSLMLISSKVYRCLLQIECPILGTTMKIYEKFSIASYCYVKR